MSSDTQKPPVRKPAAGPDREPGVRLGYLLKHAHQRFTELAAAALAPYQLDGRELAVLGVLGGDRPTSQQSAAQRLRVDRTTMVALVDALEDKGLVVRHPDAGDRRRNLVELTAAGRNTLELASRVADDVERRFLARIGEPAAQQLKNALRTLVMDMPGD